MATRQKYAGTGMQVQGDSAHAVAVSGHSYYDVVIVGGGSAGAVMANRLSEDAFRRVLLIEAGQAYAPDAYPDAVRLQHIIGGDSAHDWGYSAEPNIYGATMPVPRGKVLGGCSAVNAGVAMRAPAGDFERWTQAGLEHWTAQDVLPFFQRSERTVHGDDALHGRSGPWPIHYLQDDEVSDMQRAFVASAAQAGFAKVTDFNGEQPFGVGPYPMNNRMGQRLNTGMTYLSLDVRMRPNLCIRSQTLVDRVAFDGRRAAAVVLADGQRIEADNIVLSAGTYGTAAVLLRSGIGPANDLLELDIDVVANLPVGQRLQEHPFFYTTWAARPDRLGLAVPPVGAILWAQSSKAAANVGDFHVSAVHYGDPQASPTGAIFMLALALTRPRSLGRVRLRSRAADAAPIIALNLLADAHDRQLMVEGIELIRRIARQGPLAAMIAEEMVPGALSSSYEDVEAALPMALDIYHHPTSTAPMGGANDVHAVLDYQGRVRGIDGLRVADASAFPDVPCVATNPTVIMLAERISQWMRDADG